MGVEEVRCGPAAQGPELDARTTSGRAFCWGTNDPEERLDLRQESFVAQPQS